MPFDGGHDPTAEPNHKLERKTKFRFLTFLVFTMAKEERRQSGVKKKKQQRAHIKAD